MTGNRVPGWLANDREWKAKLDALTDEDVDLLERQWHLAGGWDRWDVDTSWITWEQRADKTLTVIAWASVAFLVVFVCAAVLVGFGRAM